MRHNINKLGEAMKYAAKINVVSLILLGLGACASQEYLSSDSGSAGWSESGAMADESDVASGSSTSGTSTDWEPEQELDARALSPAATDIYVFVANPDRNTVTRVHVFSHAVDTTDVGSNPTAVMTTPDYATAVVFNEDDDTVSIIDAVSMEQDVVEVRPNFNTMVMSHDGVWVALWYLSTLDEGDVGGDGVQSFNEVSFVNVATGEHHPMAVGPNPSQVIFTKDDAIGLVVSDESLAVVDMSAETLLPEMVTIADDLLNPPIAEEVVLSPDGSYAFVRQFGETTVALVDLYSHDVSRIEAGGNPTDLDLTPDGSAAVIVARDARELWIYDALDPHSAPQVVDTPTSLVVGSIQFDPTGTRAALYSTAANEAIYASWDMGTNEIQVRPLEKPIDSVSIAPSGETMLIFHGNENAEGASSSSPFYNAYAMTMIDLLDFRSTAVLMDADSNGYAHSSNGNFGFFIMEDEPYLIMLDYASLLPYPYELKSEPIYVGVLPDLDMNDADEPPTWVSQEHDLGRISFFDPDDESLETITGFELNSEIEQ
jgi:DNA-binding beta-propeller fold protein YncE